jgi:hypothetical protein
MKSPILRFSAETLIQIDAFLRGHKNKDDFAISFNFAKSVSPSSPLGKAVSNCADPQSIEELAKKAWATGMSEEWSLELVSYNRSRIGSQELHDIQGICTFIPKDLEGYFLGKVVEFKDKVFLLR